MTNDAHPWMVDNPWRVTIFPCWATRTKKHVTQSKAMWDPSWWKRGYRDNDDTVINQTISLGYQGVNRIAASAGNMIDFSWT